MDPNHLRESVARELSSSDDTGCTQIGATVADTSACWGEIGASFAKHASSTEQCLHVLDALVRAGHRAPMLLFLHLVREREDVLRAVWQQAATLPASVQRMLVAMPQCEALLESLPDDLHPGARQLALRAPEVRAQEARAHRALVAGLLALRRGAGPASVEEILDQLREHRRQTGGTGAGKPSMKK